VYRAVYGWGLGGAKLLTYLRTAPKHVLDVALHV
jgi:hypothetical protein